MALHQKFPKDKFAIADPEVRWFPAEEDLRKQGFEKLLPPLVAKVREEVKKWRENDYKGASETSRALLNWWFKEPHIIYDEKGIANEFQYYFAQREAVESIIWLYDVAGVGDKYDLIRYDSSNLVTPGMFTEEWLRLVIKMATGTGKTKVMSLMLAWSYFHKLYEKDSELSKNFLLITPNIIVLDRIKYDFIDLKIFHQDPVLPDNGYQGQNWQDDFQLNMHLQDEIGTISKNGNIFLTNIHRVYEGDVKEPSIKDDDTSNYFLGKKAVARTQESRIDLGKIIRDIDELVVINDEAHHIHDPKMAWFKSIDDIHNKLLQKGKKLSLQIDVTATPKHTNGAIFVQTISDYPLVEAIYQNVVKNPVLPDQASRARLQEKQSSIFTEKYEDFINLGVKEWRKTYKELKHTGKKSILFVMTDDTKNCDEVAEYLEKNFPDLKNAVLTIHTNRSGEISESKSGKKEKELKELRDKSNKIDSSESPYKAIVSVLMLKEGWDVKNVTTIVGLRAYTSKANILPEQTLGRGLRKMFFGIDDLEDREYVSVIGTPAFMEFVESIKAEGVDFETRKMDTSSSAISPTVIEVDNENVKKDIEKLDIELPILTPRIQREYKNLNLLDVSKFANKKVKIKEFSEEEKKQIVFKHIIGDKEHHVTILDSKIEPNYQSVVGFFAQAIMKELRLFGCYDILFGKVKEFINEYLFDKEVNLENVNILRNLSEIEARKTIIETFKKEINALTVQDVGDTEVKNFIKISQTRPFIVSDKKYLIPKKCVFNKIVGDSNFELEFSDFLEKCEDIISYAKNFREIHFKIDYKTATGTIANYYPDFFVKVDNKTIYIIETKGRESLDDIEKIKRLKQWCKDASERKKKITYHMLYVKYEDWIEQDVRDFDELIKVFG